MSESTVRGAVFVDRDGVLNDLVDRGDGFRVRGKPIRWTAPFHREEVRIKPEARAALDIFASKGYLRFMVTNQPDVAEGFIPPDEFPWIMRMFEHLPLTGVYACTHHPLDGCLCRKPAPGMLHRARDEYQVDMSRSFMIGDMETDIEAGRAAGVRTILVTTDISIATKADYQVASILDAAKLLP